MAVETTIVHHADVRCMDARDTRAEAIAWRDGAILAVGGEVDVAGAAGPGAHRIDAAGATVLPGFIDAHHHPCIAALYGGRVRLAPPAVRDVAELQAALARASAELDDPTRWLVAVDWDELLLRERRAPTRQELDDAVPDRPVFAMHYSCHRAVANSRALEAAGIDARTPEPSGGEIGRGRRGLPNGLLIERAMSRVETLARASLVAHDAEGFFDRLAAHHRAIAASGITRVFDATVPGDLAAMYREAARRGLLLVPTVMMPVSTSGYLETPWDALEGPVTGETDGLLSIGPLKLVLDGAPGCAMCLGVWQSVGVLAGAFALAARRGSLDPVRASMSVTPSLGRDLRVRTGIHIYRRGEVEAIVRAATDRGFAIATHAIGNDAVDHALEAFAATRATLDRAGQPRIEHALFIGRATVERIAGMGAAVVTQPHMLSLPAFDNAPPVPGLRIMPLRWLLDAGVKVVGSSDYSVAAFDPLAGMRSAMSRTTASGRVYEPDQRVSLDEALAMYTRVAAEVTGCIHECGTLEVGKRADVVILDTRLGAEGSIDDASVRTTVIGGAIARDALTARR